MKAVYAGLAAAMLVTVAAGFGLPYLGWSAEDRQSSKSVGLD